MSEDSDTQLLMKALNNENNNSIINLSNSKIKSDKNDILQKLGFRRDILKQYHTKLRNYRYIDKLDDINYGFYVRWIKLDNPEKLRLTNGGIVVDVKEFNDRCAILCRGINTKVFWIYFDNAIIFQRLTNQEQILLSVLDYLSK
jgi:hypothetical protein